MIDIIWLYENIKSSVFKIDDGKHNGKNATRYTFDKPLTINEKALLKKNGAIIGTCSYRYAREIAHDYIIVIDD